MMSHVLVSCVNRLVFWFERKMMFLHGLGSDLPLAQFCCPLDQGAKRFQLLWREFVCWSRQFGQEALSKVLATFLF
jgi:hypothetical protein